MAAPTLADAFVSSYTGMQENKRRNRELELQEARAAAQEEYNQALLEMKQQEMAYDQNPNSIDNQYKQAQVTELTERGPRREREAQLRADAAERKADDLAAKNAETSRLARIKEAFNAWRGSASAPGVTAGEAAIALNDAEKNEFFAQILKVRTSEYERQAQLADDKAAGLIERLFSPTDTVMQQGAAPAPATPPPGDGSLGSIFAATAGAALGGPAGMAAGGGVPSPAPAQGVPYGDLSGAVDMTTQIAQIMQGAYKDIGLPPTMDDILTAKHPATEAFEKKRAYEEKLAQARTELVTNQAARQKVLMSTDKALRESLIEARKDRDEVARERLKLNQANAKRKDFYDGEKLKIEKLRVAVSQQNANANTSRAGTYAANNAADVKDAQFLRGLAKWEYQANDREVRTMNKAIGTLQQNVRTWEAILNGMPTAADDTEVPGGKGMTVGQLKMQVSAAQADLDPTNETSLAYRRAELIGTNSDLEAMLAGNMPDQQVVSQSGKVITSSPSVGTKGAGAAKTGRAGAGKPGLPVPPTTQKAAPAPNDQEQKMQNVRKFLYGGK